MSETTIGMKIAKPSQEDLEAMCTLAAILNRVQLDGIGRRSFPMNEDGIFWEDDPEYFDEDNPEHLRAFYDRVMGCAEKSPGCAIRVIFGMATAMRNDVFDPDSDTLEWHPDLKAVAEARLKKGGNRE